MYVSVLGTGLLGGEIALRLRTQGIDVGAWNRTPERAAPLAVAGVRLFESAAAAIAAADVTLMLLADAAAIDSTLFSGEPQPDLSGRTIVQMGTIAPDESCAIGERVEGAGGAYLEAPVLGSLPEARSGTLLVMASGDQTRFQRLLPMFEALSEAPMYIGPLGQAAALKLALNQLIVGLTATFSVSLGLVRSAGLDVEQFMGLVRQSALYAPTYDKKLPKYLAHAYASANFPLKHLLKDARLIERVLAAQGIDAATVGAVADAAERGIAAGHGDSDYSSIYEALVRNER
jgi:3-hydroxyisobutyrate dehydrogenase